MWDIFLSYSHANHEMADWLRGELETLGMKVWWDGYYVETFDQHVHRISEGISESRAFLALLSEEYTNSKYAPDELDVAAATQHVLRDRFPSFTRSILLAVLDSPVVLPDRCIGLLDIGEDSPFDGLLSDEDGLVGKSVTIASQMQAALLQSGVVFTPSYVMFPLHGDDLERSSVVVRYAIRKWDAVFSKTWSDMAAGDVPEEHPDRATYARRIWNWIGYLKRYGEVPIPVALDFCDRLTKVCKAGEQEDALGVFMNVSGSVMLAKAAYHLWMGRKYSLVFDPDRAQGDLATSERYIPTPHFGNPTDNVIGIARAQRPAVTCIANMLRASRSLNSDTSLVFDLSMLAAMIASYEDWYKKLPDFNMVEDRIIKPVVNGEDPLDEYC